MKKDHLSYVVEEQSRGVGAIATRDLGLTARTSGGELLARKRSSGRFPAKAYEHRSGMLLSQPSRKVVANAVVPNLRRTVENYDKSQSHLVKETFISRPSGARVIGGVIVGNPPPLLARKPKSKVRKGVFSAVHTPKGPTLMRARTLNGLGTTQVVTTYKGGYADQCRAAGFPDDLVPTCSSLLKYGSETPQAGGTPMSMDQVLAYLGPKLIAPPSTPKEAVSAPQPAPTTPATVPPPTAVERAPVPAPAAPRAPAVAAKKGLNWVVIGGIAGAGVLALLLLRK